MVADRHLGFVVHILGPPAKSTLGSFLLCNLVGIAAVILIIRKLEYFACSA